MPRKYSGLRDGDRLWPKVVKSETCWAWGAQVDRDGYGKLKTFEQRGVRAHVYAWWLATGHWPAGDEQVCHICDVPNCVRNDEVGTYEVDDILYERRGHLWLGTNAANVRDRHLKGRTADGDRSGSRLYPDRRARGDRNGSHLYPERLARGEANGLAKLTDAQVTEMRSLSADGWSLRGLGRHFKVSARAVTRIVRRETWRHI
jgi:hypothetical protein